MPSHRIFFCFAALLGLLLGGTPCRAQSATASEIERRVDLLRSNGTVELGGGTITGAIPLLAAYEQVGFAPLWTDAAARRDLVLVLQGLRADGLDPASYHYAAISAPSVDPDSAARAADLDLLRTAALIQVVHDLRFGRVHPALPGIHRELSPSPGKVDPTALRRMISSGRLYDEVARFRPRHFVYRGLMTALANLRQIAAAGGWERVPAGRALRRDSTDARVPALRRRLVREGYAGADSAAGMLFDAALERAVQSFQHHHGLNEDGVVGAGTLSELNVTVETRIDQVRISLERARWITHDLPQTFLAVNTAGAKVYLVRGESVVFETRAIVGKDYTKTPMFRAEMRYIDLNPTWTVPSGIVDEVLAEVRLDPGYLERERVRVLDRSGAVVDPATIDFSRYSRATFPYVFRQEPGPTNPLGRIKFVFPNAYSVYLHDTPSRSLFEREQRTFSHGCIRVADPVRLAELILDDPQMWNRDALESAIEPGQTMTVSLRKPVPVLVFYWTASADPSGELHFYRDQYRRDPALLRELGRNDPAPGAPTAR